MSEPRRFSLGVLAGFLLVCASLGCTARSRLDGGTTPEAAWIPPQMVEWKDCRSRSASLYQGPLPSEPYHLAVLAEIDPRGRVRSAEVLDRWPLPGACADVAPWEEPHLREFFKDYTFAPARRDGRPVTGSWVAVTVVGASQTAEPERARVVPRCSATRAKLSSASLEDAEHHLGILAAWEGFGAGLLLDIDSHGAVETARIPLRRPWTLDPAEEPWASTLLNWIRHEWSFTPATRDGLAVPSRAWLKFRVVADGQGQVVEAKTLEETFNRAVPSTP